MANKIPSSYYEGILQLRNPSQQIIDFVEKSVEESGKCRIAKVRKVQNGFDIYLTKQHYLRTLGKMLKQRFAGNLKITATLHTRSRTGEDLYRITVLFEVHDIKKGDIINIGDEKYRIEVLGRNIFLKDIKSGKKIHKSFEDIKRYLKNQPLRNQMI